MRTQSIDPKISSVFKSVDQNASEVLVHNLYHIKTLVGNPDGSVTIAPELSYFQIKVGQSDDNGIATTYEDTNMEVAGQIGSPYKFWGQSISAFVLPAKDDETPAVKTFDKAALQKSFVNDAVKLLGRGFVTINVLNQPMFRMAPIMGIPAGQGVSTASVQGFDANVGASSVSNGWAIGSNKQPLDLYLEDQLNFDFRVAFPAGVFKLYNTVRLGFRIDGFLIRPRQGGGR